MDIVDGILILKDTREQPSHWDKDKPIVNQPIRIWTTTNQKPNTRSYTNT